MAIKTAALSRTRDKIEQRTAKVSLVTGSSAFLAVVFQLISVPFCLAYWGKENYGSWLALYAAFMLVRSFDAGFATFVGNQLNCLYHQDQIALQEHLGSAIVGIAVIGAIQLSIGLAATFSEGAGLLLGLPPGSSANHRSGWALLILIVTWILSGSYLSIVHRLQIPTGLMLQAAWWAMGFQISQFAGILLAAMLHFDLLQTSLLFSFVQCSIYLASAVYIRRKLPAYYPWWRDGRPRTGIANLGRSMVFTGSNLIQQGSANGVILLVSAMSGPGAVPIFTTIRTLANLWTSVTNVLTVPLLPEIVRYHAKGEGAKLVAVSEAYWILTGSAVNFGILLTYPLIYPLYEYWTAHSVVLDRPLLCLLLASVVVTNAGGLIALYLNGINRLNVVLAAAAARGLLYLPFGGLLFLRFGLSGFGMAILGGELLALLLTGRYFLNQELASQGGRVPLRSIASIVASSIAVFLFLTSEGFRLPYSQRVYPICLLGVATAALWGWKGLPPEVKNRLKNMCTPSLWNTNAHL